MYKVLKESSLFKVLGMTKVWSNERHCYFTDLSNSGLQFHYTRASISSVQCWTGRCNICAELIEATTGLIHHEFSHRVKPVKG